MARECLGMTGGGWKVAESVAVGWLGWLWVEVAGGWLRNV